MHKKTISQQFAQFALTLSYEGLTPSQVTLLKTFFLDWLASAFAGQSEAPVKIIDELIETMGGVPESTAIPRLKKVPCLWAALINGASSHVKEMDDLHRESIFHPAAAIMPSVFAAAERNHVSGKDMLAGIAAGYEVGIRTALAAGPAHYRHWHTTATCGTFGAAAGASKILGLTEKEFTWAMGSAGTQASGLWEFLRENAMSKQLHTGKAAFNGLLAALLAQKGFTGATNIMEGEKGFFKAVSADYNEKKCIDGLGSEFLFERNSLKYYASCGHTHAAVEAAANALKISSCEINDIDRVTVWTYPAALDLLEHVVPDTPFAAKFCLPFCVATAIKFGKAGIDDFNPSRLNDPDLLFLMKRIDIEKDEELGRDYPKKWPARIEIRTNSGDCFRGQIDYPKGDPENPLTETELVEKFFDLTRNVMDPDDAGILVERVMNLEMIADVSDLLNFPFSLQSSA